MTIAVLDLETTGLDPERHQIWEIGLIIHGHRTERLNGEFWWQMKPNLALADPLALRKNGFYSREQLWRRSPAPVVQLADPAWEPPKAGTLPSRGTSWLELARELARLLVDAQLYIAIPHFDEAFLERLMRKNDQCPMWNHRSRCVESLAAGDLGYDPGGLRNCADALDLDYNPGDLHTALGDARLADRIRQRVLRMGP